jgi:hypothetical protein
MQPDNLRADIQRAIEEVESAKKEQAAREKQISQPIPAPAVVRYHVAKVVIWSFLGYVGLVGAFVAFFDDPTKNTMLIDIMKTLLFPIVTLVIGFYFGSKAE